MKPACPDHGRLVLELALGRLDDRTATEAEEIRASCPSCRQWWTDHLAGARAEAVDQVVGDVFARFEVPRRRRLSPWLAAAAAVFLACGVLVVMRGLEPTSPGERATLRPDRLAPSAADGVALFADNLESGDLAGWVLEGAQPAPRVAAAETDNGALFVDGLESGDLSGWSS